MSFGIVGPRCPRVSARIRAFCVRIIAQRRGERALLLETSCSSGSTGCSSSSRTGRPPRGRSARCWAPRPAREAPSAYLGAARLILAVGSSEVELCEPSGPGPAAEHLRCTGRGADDRGLLDPRHGGAPGQPRASRLPLRLGGRVRSTSSRRKRSACAWWSRPTPRVPASGLVSHLYEVTNTLISDWRAAADRYTRIFGLDPSRFSPIASERFGYDGTLTHLRPAGPPRPHRDLAGDRLQVGHGTLGRQARRLALHVLRRGPTTSGPSSSGSIGARRPLHASRLRMPRPSATGSGSTRRPSADFSSASRARPSAGSGRDSRRGSRAHSGRMAPSAAGDEQEFLYLTTRGRKTRPPAPDRDLVHASRPELLPGRRARPARALGAEPPRRAARPLAGRPVEVLRARARGEGRDGARAGARHPGALEAQIRLGRRPRRRARPRPTPSPPPPRCRVGPCCFVITGRGLGGGRPPGTTLSRIPQALSTPPRDDGWSLRRSSAEDMGPGRAPAPQPPPSRAPPMDTGRRGRVSCQLVGGGGGWGWRGHPPRTHIFCGGSRSRQPSSRGGVESGMRAATQCGPRGVPPPPPPAVNPP